MKQDLNAYDRAYLRQGLSDADALSEGLIDYDDLEDRYGGLTRSEWEEEHKEDLEAHRLWIEQAESGALDVDFDFNSVFIE